MWFCFTLNWKLCGREAQEEEGRFITVSLKVKEFQDLLH